MEIGNKEFQWRYLHSHKYAEEPLQCQNPQSLCLLWKWEKYSESLDLYVESSYREHSSSPVPSAQAK